MYTNTAKICEGLAGIGCYLDRFIRASAENGWDVNGRVLKNSVRRCNSAEITTSAGERYPRRGSDQAVLIDHLWRVIGSTARWVKERSGPISKRNAGSGCAIGLEVAKAV